MKVLTATCNRTFKKERIVIYSLDEAVGIVFGFTVYNDKKKNQYLTSF